jgi:predicted GNAT family acetyltransferase
MDFNYEENRIYKEDEDGKLLCEITFTEIKPGLYNINHTFVDESLRGQGIAKILVEEAIKTIRKKNGKITATCSYAKNYLEKNNIKE